MSQRPGRYAVKVDANQKEIVHALESVGCSVACTHMVGRGFADLVVGYYDIKTGEPTNLLMEVKTPEGKLNDLETEFHRNWKGRIVVVHNILEALEAVGRL